MRPFHGLSSAGNCCEHWSTMLERQGWRCCVENRVVEPNSNNWTLQRRGKYASLNRDWTKYSASRSTGR